MLKSLGNFILDFLEVIFFAFAIFLFLYLLVLQPHKIKGVSMEPNFPNGEFLLTDKVTYRRREPMRGDVVVFKPPLSPDDEYIKRIIALPGETVSVKGDKVYLNGQLLEESYLDPALPTASNAFLKEGMEYVVPAGQYVVFGDNRPHSADSRLWGPIEKGKITGKAWLVYWPLKNFGTVKDVNYKL